METIQKIALVFTIIGAINWGLIGLFQEGSFLTKLIYIIIGICGLVNIAILFKHLEFE